MNINKYSLRIVMGRNPATSAPIIETPFKLNGNEIELMKNSFMSRPIKLVLHTLDDAEKTVLCDKEEPPFIYRTISSSNPLNIPKSWTDLSVIIYTRTYQYYTRELDPTIPDYITNDPTKHYPWMYLYHYKELVPKETKQIENKDSEIKTYKRQFDL